MLSGVSVIMRLRPFNKKTNSLHQIIYIIGIDNQQFIMYDNQVLFI